MTTSALPKLTAGDIQIDSSVDRFGILRSSDDIVWDAPALRERMLADGYLFLPGLLDKKETLAARQFITDRLAAEDMLDSSYPSIDCVPRAGVPMMFRPDLVLDNAPLKTLLYSGSMMEFFLRFFGEEVRHYDYTWLRTAVPGQNTSPHCDIVYMGRGTFDELTRLRLGALCA